MVRKRVNTSGASFTTKWNWSGAEQGKRTMDREAGQILGDTIYKILKTEGDVTAGKMKSEAPPTMKRMFSKVADSFMAEQRPLGENGTSVIFGSAPIDSGGVKGSRGGKIAQYLNRGVKAFSMGRERNVNLGKEFITISSESEHPGFPAVKWLQRTMNRAVPQIDDAIITALDTSWGGGGP